jgi:hypothetical protein
VEKRQQAIVSLRTAYDAHAKSCSVLDVVGHPAIDHADNAMTRAPLTADAARAVIVDICQLAVGRPVTSVIICDPRVAAQRSLSQMLHPLQSLVGITCVRDGFALMDAYSAQASDIVLIGIDRSSNAGAEAIALQLAMHPESVIITVGAATEAELLVAATITGARGLLIWDHHQGPPDGGPQPDGPLAW